MKTHLYKRAQNGQVILNRTECGKSVANGLKTNDSTEAYKAEKTKGFSILYETTPKDCCLNCISKAKEQNRIK